MRLYFFALGMICALSILTVGGPKKVFAHEVYVLDHSEINFAMQMPEPDFLSAIKEYLPEFLLWGTLVILLIIGIFFISVWRPLERALTPFLHWLKRYAPLVAQITLGLALFASGYYHAAFGIELPLGGAFGSYAHPMAIVFMTIGTMLLLGVFPRLAATVAVAIFVALCIAYGIYMTNYATYAGEALTLVLFGGAYSLHRDDFVSRIFSKMIGRRWHRYKFFMMRIMFGISLIYASLYAKFFHGGLALQTVAKYNLTNYFHFNPVFLVLGALLIELLIGLFFIIGFEIRFASLFFLVFLSMSLSFFGESVWPHIVLIGTAFAMFMHGYDRYTVSEAIAPESNLEPVL